MCEPPKTREHYIWTSYLCLFPMVIFWTTYKRNAYLKTVTNLDNYIKSNAENLELRWKKITIISGLYFASIGFLELFVFEWFLVLEFFVWSLQFAMGIHFALHGFLLADMYKQLREQILDLEKTPEVEKESISKVCYSYNNFEVLYDTGKVS